MCVEAVVVPQRSKNTRERIFAPKRGSLSSSRCHKTGSLSNGPRRVWMGGNAYMCVCVSACL